MNKTKSVSKITEKQKKSSEKSSKFLEKRDRSDDGEPRIIQNSGHLWIKHFFICSSPRSGPIVARGSMRVWSWNKTQQQENKNKNNCRNVKRDNRWPSCPYCFTVSMIMCCLQSGQVLPPEVTNHLYKQCRWKTPTHCLHFVSGSSFVPGWMTQ